MKLAHELRNNLIHRIEHIDDVNFLQAIQTILDSSDKGVFELNELQLKSISESRKELENGDGVDHEKVLSSLKGWLKNG